MFFCPLRPHRRPDLKPTKASDFFMSFLKEKKMQRRSWGQSFPGPTAHWGHKGQLEQIPPRSTPSASTLCQGTVHPSEHPVPLPSCLLFHGVHSTLQ